MMDDDRTTELVPLSLDDAGSDRLRRALDEGRLDDVTLADLLDETGERALADFIAYADATDDPAVSVHTDFLDWLFETRREEVRDHFQSLTTGDCVRFNVGGDTGPVTGTVATVIDESGQGDAQTEVIIEADADASDWPQYGLVSHDTDAVTANGLTDDGGERLGYVTDISEA